jgi:hypothetical protein
LCGVLISLNRQNEGGDLFDPISAGTIEAVSIARVVVFAVICGKTVAFGGRIPMPQI